MTKPGLLHILLLAGSILSSGAVWAADLKETVPGTKYSKVSPKPYGELEFHDADAGTKTNQGNLLQRQ